MGPNPYRQLEEKVVNWAESRPDIRAVVVVGSRARTDHPADELADLDLILFSENPQTFLHQPEDLERIAPLWLVVANHVEAAHPEWLVLFAGGYKVDFYFAPIVERSTLTDTLPQMPFQSVLARGLRVLVDKTTGSSHESPERGAATIARAVPESGRTTDPPTAGRFYARLDSSLLSASRAVKFIQRGDIWRAKFQIDSDLKRHLLSFIEWQAQAAADWQLDTWYDGRFLVDWATPHVLDFLPGTFGVYDRRDLLRALKATLDLLDWLARDTADRLAIRYPHTRQEAVLAWLNEQIALSHLTLG